MAIKISVGLSIIPNRSLENDKKLFLMTDLGIVIFFTACTIFALQKKCSESVFNSIYSAVLFGRFAYG